MPNQAHEQRAHEARPGPRTEERRFGTCEKASEPIYSIPLFQALSMFV